MAEYYFVQHVMCLLLGPKNVDAGIYIPVTREFLETVDNNVLCQHPSWRVDAAMVNPLCDSVLLISDHLLFPRETEDALETPQVNVTEAAQEFSLVEENVTPRTGLPPLLVPLRERRPERLHYLRVSFGLTLDLFRFWGKDKFARFFIGNSPALKYDDVEAVGSDEWGFYGPYYREYKRILVDQFSTTYWKMNYKLAMSVSATSESLIFLKFLLAPLDIKKLEDYSNNLSDYPSASILLCYGLQWKDFPEIEREMGLKRRQILPLFVKVMQRLYKYLNNLTSKDIDTTVPHLKAIMMEPHSISVDEDLNDAAKKVQFAIVDREVEFGNALQNGGGKIVPGSVVSVKSKHSKSKETEKSGKKRNKNCSESKSSKKRRS